MALIHDGFLLENSAAEALYKTYAENAPIFDYHSHLRAEDLFHNGKYGNITRLWLESDHYKWRMLRIAGVEEKYITGDADDYDKFLCWSEVVGKAIGNPIYHWTHLELRRYFGIEELLNKKTAPAIWERCNQKLREEAFRPAPLLEKTNVKGVCTIDDPADDLTYHAELEQNKEIGFRVLPTFRPDRAFQIGSDHFLSWLEQLEKAAGMSIENLEDFEAALERRCRYFKQAGCLSADQAVENPDFTLHDRSLAEAAFQKARAGGEIDSRERAAYRTEIMTSLGKMYHELGLVMQLHLGCARNINDAMFRKIGADSGFDTMGEPISIGMLAPLFNKLFSSKQLPKTILFSSNGSDHQKLTAFSNCFQEAGIAGRVQTGAAWWFLDHKDGIESYLKSFSRQGMLAVFAGMLTDSRSVLSMSRHEYFRRILCSLLGNWVEKGEIPNDNALLGEIIQDICYHNAVKFFHFKEKHRE